MSDMNAKSSNALESRSTRELIEQEVTLYRTMLFLCVCIAFLGPLSALLTIEFINTYDTMVVSVDVIVGLVFTVFLILGLMLSVRGLVRCFQARHQVKRRLRSALWSGKKPEHPSDAMVWRVKEVRRLTRAMRTMRLKSVLNVVSMLLGIVLMVFGFFAVVEFMWELAETIGGIVAGLIGMWLVWSGVTKGSRHAEQAEVISVHYAHLVDGHVQPGALQLSVESSGGALTLREDDASRTVFDEEEPVGDSVYVE